MTGTDQPRRRYGWPPMRPINSDKFMIGDRVALTGSPGMIGTVVDGPVTEDETIYKTIFWIIQYDNAGINGGQPIRQAAKLLELIP